MKQAGRRGSALKRHKTIRAKELFTTLNMETAGGSPADLKSFIGAEIEKWGPIVKAANITF